MAGTSARRTRSAISRIWRRGCAAAMPSKPALDFRKYPGFCGSTSRCGSTPPATSHGGPNPQAAAAASGSGVADSGARSGAGEATGFVDREDYNHPYLGLYLQDEFRATPKLTFTYGLRYNLEPSWSEAKDRLGFIDTQSPSPIAGQVPGVSNLVGGVGFAGTGDNGVASSDHRQESLRSASRRRLGADRQHGRARWIRACSTIRARSMDSKTRPSAPDA